VALAGAGRPEEESVFALAHEAGGGELVDESAVHLLVEVEVEAVERAVGVAEAGLLGAPLEETVLAPLQFVTHEHRDGVEGCHLLRLRLAQPCLEHVGHSRQTQVPQGTVEFDEVHAGSPVFLSMRSQYSVSRRMSGSTWRRDSGTCGRRSR